MQNSNKRENKEVMEGIDLAMTVVGFFFTGIVVLSIIGGLGSKTDEG